jgi:hypothetical protein
MEFLMLEDRTLNPLDISEGGNPSASAWGNDFKRLRLEGPKTYLPDRDEFVQQYGSDPRPYTIRPSLPLIDESQGGPIFLAAIDDPNFHG